METESVQIIGALPWLVCYACRASMRDFCSALAALVNPVQILFFLTVHFFPFLCPHRPESWAGSRDCVSDTDDVLTITICYNKVFKTQISASYSDHGSLATISR